MPAVPYKPFPQEEAKVSATPGYNLRVPTEAFGSSVGTAFEKLGTQIEHSADTFSKIVLEQKKLENDTWVNNALTKGEQKVGKLQEDYRQQEGQNAVDAHPGHVQAIEDTRQEILDSAPNPEAKRMFDDRFTRRTSAMIVDSGAHAGQQAKVANKESAETNLQTQITNFNASAVDAEARRQDIRNGIARLGTTRGWHPDVIKEKSDKAIELATASSIMKQAPVDPSGAAAALATATKDKTITSQDVLNNVAAKVNPMMTSKDVSEVATEILKGYEVDGSSLSKPYDPKDGTTDLESIQALAEDIGDRRGRGIPGYTEHLVAAVTNRVHTLDGQYKQARDKQMAGFMYWVGGGGNPAGPITSEDGILADPEKAKIWADMKPAERDHVLRQIHASNKLHDPPLSDPGVSAAVSTLQGLFKLARMGDKDALEQISNTAIAQANIPQSYKNGFYKEKLSMTGKAEDDPKFNQYLTEARPLLNKLGMAPSINKEKGEEYFRFVGEFSKSITAWEQEHGGKSPDVKQRNELAQSLLKDQVRSQKGGGWFGRDLTSERYKVYSEHRDEMIDDYMQSHNGQTPTEAELRRAFEKAFPAVH